MAATELTSTDSQLQRIEITGNRLPISFSVDAFRSKLRNIVRPNIFEVSFDALPVLLGDMKYTVSTESQHTVQDMKFRCERAELPGKTIATVDDVSLGPTLKMPYETTYSDIQLTFICAGDMFERRFFESWMDEIVALPGPHGLGGLVRYYDEFALGSKITVRQGDSKGLPVVSYSLYDAFPIALSPMTLAWEESNTYQRFTVTMSYRYHVMNFPKPIY